jgi:hypothetical protein
MSRKQLKKTQTNGVLLNQKVNTWAMASPEKRLSRKTVITPRQYPEQIITLILRD